MNSGLWCLWLVCQTACWSADAATGLCNSPPANLHSPLTSNTHLADTCTTVALVPRCALHNRHVYPMCMLVHCKGALGKYHQERYKPVVVYMPSGPSTTLILPLQCCRIDLQWNRNGAVHTAARSIFERGGVQLQHLCRCHRSSHKPPYSQPRRGSGWPAGTYVSDAVVFS